MEHSQQGPTDISEAGACVLSHSVSLSHVQLFVWTVAHQASLSMEFFRQEYWSGLPFPSSGDLPDPGIEPRSPALQQTLYCLSHQGSPVAVQGLSCPPWACGIFPDQGWNPCSLHWQADSIHSTTLGEVHFHL